MGIVEQWLTRINQWLEIALLGALVVGVVYLWVVRPALGAFRHSGSRAGVRQIVERLALLLLIAVMVLLARWFWMRLEEPWIVVFKVLFWLILIGAPPILVYLLTRRYSRQRGLRTALFHVLVLALGWWLGRALGLLVFSLPLLVIFYWYLYHAALVIVPASRPEDRAEQIRRFQVLLYYAWGMQASMYVVADHAGRRVERCISGPIARGFGAPGLIWMRAHQVAGITSGVEFRRVDGPGLVFLSRLERPFQIMDLRNQLRVSSLEVTSQDGIRYTAILFMAFRLDREVWDAELYDRICKENPLLERARRPDHLNTTYPFSSLRVQAVLSKTGLKIREGEQAPLYWDEWVVSQVEEVARQELHQHPIDGFWQREGGVTGALEAISRTITERARSRLRVVGVHLLTARIVNFRFPEGAERDIDRISQQQIESWKATWERKREETLAQSEAEANRLQQEAWAYAQSLLLTSIAEGFEQVKKMHPELPPSAIALLFLSAVQDYITRYQSAEEANLATMPMAWGRRKSGGHEEKGQEG